MTRRLLESVRKRTMCRNVMTTLVFSESKSVSGQKQKKGTFPFHNIVSQHISWCYSSLRASGQVQFSVSFSKIHTFHKCNNVQIFSPYRLLSRLTLRFGQPPVLGPQDWHVRCLKSTDTSQGLSYYYFKNTRREQSSYSVWVLRKLQRQLSILE